jgi:hypothetical protein
VKKNTVQNTVIGLYTIALASEPLPPFGPITGAESKLGQVSIVDNAFMDNVIGALVWGFSGFGEAGKGKVINPALVRNDFKCAENGFGIFIVNEDVINAKVVNNSFSDCEQDFIDGGTDTK